MTVDMAWFPWVTAFLLGLALGSFGNVLAYRVPRRESVVFPGSHCPRCGHPLSWFENVPLLSWIFLRGRCRHCGAPVSVRYPLVEAATALLFLLLVWKYPLNWGFFFYLPLFVVVIPLTLIDLEYQLLPNRLIFPVLGLGILLNLGNYFLPAAQRVLDPWWSGLAGGLAAFALFWFIAEASLRLLGKEGMGGGDVKLMAVLGLYLGLPKVLLTIFLASLLGTVSMGLPLLLGVGERGRRFAFGPFLLLGALLSLFLGDPLIQWYLNWALNG